MPTKSPMAKRLSRLENAFAQQQAQIERDSIDASVAASTPTERRARIRELIERLMKARGIEPTCGESFEDAALRAVQTLSVVPSGIAETLRIVYGVGT